MPLEKKAYELALRGHRGQVRKFTGIPYIVHPVNVVGYLRQWQINNPIMKAAGYCHDLLEDTDITSKEIYELDNRKGRVLKLVEALSFIGDQRQKRLWVNHLASNANIEVITIKLADRIDNTYGFLHSGKVEKATTYWRDSVILYEEFDRRFYPPPYLKSGIEQSIFELTKMFVHLKENGE